MAFQRLYTENIHETLLVKKMKIKDYFSIEPKLMKEGLFDLLYAVCHGNKASIVTN